MAPAKRSDQYLILAVEESASSVGFYDSKSGNEVGRVALSLWPHEIAVSSDGMAYVSNFGVRDYDLSLGFAGNSVSVIDIAGRNESGRIFTGSESEPFWGPHGVKLSPDEAYLFVNVERVLGVREPDLNKPGSEYTKLLKFDRQTGACLAVVDVPLAEFDRRELSIDRETTAYDVIPGTHNFVFSPENPDELWLFSGKAGVSVFSVSRGEIIHRMTSFNGAVRSLYFGKSGQLLVSATNEVSLVDPISRTITKKFGNLGVGQILYSSLTPDERFILAPAVWEGQVLVINVDTHQIDHRITTGVDPVRVVISPDETRAYVTHGRTRCLSYIELSDLSQIAGQISTKGGPNGIAFAKWSSPPAVRKLKLAACLPFTGPHAAQGRELRLGYQHWQDKVNAAGGITVDARPHLIEFEFADTASSSDEEIIRRLTKSLIDQFSPIVVVGSYPSTADRWVGTQAVSDGLPFITGVGDHQELFDGRNSLAFSLAPVRPCILEGVLRCLRHRLSPKPQSACVIAADAPEHIEEALRTVEFALHLGFEVVPSAANESFWRHPPHSQFPEDLLVQISDASPDLLLVVNDQEDAISVVRASSLLGFRPGGIALSCDVTNPALRDRLGLDASGLLGGDGWLEAISFAEDRFGAASDFSRGYFDEFSEHPSYLAAAGSGVGVTLEAALSCGCATPTAISEALSSLQMSSFFTQISFDSRGRNTRNVTQGIQIDMTEDAWVRTPIWPPNRAGRRRPRWPY